MDLNQFAVDPAAYENGKRIDLGPDEYIIVRSAGSVRGTKVRERLWKPYSTWTEVPAEVLDTLNAQWIAQGLLVGMHGITHDGARLDLDLTKKEDQDRLVKIITSPKMKGFRLRIIQIAISEANFQAGEDDVIEGNSDGSHAGASSGANTPNE